MLKIKRIRIYYEVERKVMPSLSLLMTRWNYSNKWNTTSVRRCYVVPTFQPDRPSLILGGVWDFSIYPGIRCVPFLFCTLLSLPVALTFCWPALVYRSSVLVHSLYFPTCISLMGIWVLSLGGVSLTLGRVNKMRIRKKKRKVSLESVL